MTEREALKLALEALETVRHKIDSYQVNVCDDVDEAITAIREALAQPAQQEGCQCPACQVLPHASDCAVHSEPAYPKGKCNCGAQPEQEPVAHVVIVGDMVSVSTGSNGLKELHKLGDGAPLYTTPPQPEPVIDKSAAERIATALGWEPKRKPLTDEAIATVYWGATGQSLRPQDNVLAHKFARAIEAAHGIKENT